MTRPAIGVLVKRFPKLSETFILSEMLALEALGWPVTIFTLCPPSDAFHHPDVARIAARVCQLDTAEPVADLASQLRSGAIVHLHAHFAGNPAAIARAAAAQAGISYSVSAHAKDIYLTAATDLRANLSAARFVVTCTAHNADHLRHAVPGVPIAKLYHRIDCDKLRPAPSPASPTPPLILSIGRLRTKKGLDTLVEACGLLRDRGRSFACEIIGYGPEKAPLATLTASLQLGDRVRLLGKMPHDAVLDRLRAARLFALPCRIDPDGDRDGIPNVILEAMAMGVPVVSTSVSGVPEVIDHARNGILVVPDNPSLLADAIEDIFRDPAKAATIATAARATVVARFGEGRDVRMLDLLLQGAACPPATGIGYVVKGFPRLSESFISNEVLKLEQLGNRLCVFACARGDELATPVLAEMTSPLAYLPSAGSVSQMGFGRWLGIIVPAYAPSHWRLVRRRPGAYARALWQTILFARAYRYRGERFAKLAFFKQFAQAGAIAEALPRAGITHLHGHFCHSATTITWLAAQLAGCEFSFTAHAKDIYQARHNPGNLLARKIAAAKFITTCTEANRTYLTDKLGPVAKLHTIYHGLDTGYFQPDETNSVAVPRLIAVGRHVEKKGFDLLIRALAQLRDEGVTVECRLVGETGPATRSLTTLIAELGMTDAISLDPPESRSALCASYRRASIFVLPCRIDDSGDRDGIPNVLAEAMATGLAVISTRVSGIPELVRDDDNGLLVEPNDVASLADAIEALVGNDLLRARLGAQAARTIREMFDADRTILAMKRLFDDATLEYAA